MEILDLRLQIADLGESICNLQSSICHQWTRFSIPFQNGSRSSALRILPVPPLGSCSRNSMRLGILNPARFCLQCSSSSSAVAAVFGLRTTSATGISPHFSSGAATTAHSNTAGCAYSATSISTEEIFSPRSEEHTSELQSPTNLVCRLLLE